MQYSALNAVRIVSVLVVKHPKHVFVHYSETAKTEVPSYRLHQKNIKRGSSGSCLGAFGLVLMIVMLPLPSLAFVTKSVIHCFQVNIGISGLTVVFV